jgi:peptidoglycan/LPS O-acetylase OafA/YrhL
MLGSLLLLQSWVPGQHTAIAVNVPAWSLSCEVAFYAALPFVAPRILRAPASELRRWGFLTAAWIGVGTAAALVLPLEWWPGVRAPEFLTGVLLASWMRRGWRPGRITKTVGTVSCLLLVGLTLSPVSIAQPVLPLLAAPGCVALISVVAVIDLSDRRTILHSTALRKLGDWSYPLYLTHWIVVVLLSRFLLGAAWIPVAMLISVALAAAIHTCLERPAQLRLRTPSNSSQRPLANRPPIVPAEGARS